MMAQAKTVQGEMMTQFVGWAAIFGSAAWTTVITVFLLKNDFAKATLDPIYPALGAVVLSVLIGIKLIFLDSPKPFHFRSNVSILQNLSSGQITGLYWPTTDDRDFFAGDPLWTFDTLVGVTKLNPLNLGGLHVELLASNASQKLDELFLNEFEYIFFHWLADLNRYGWLNSRISNVGINSGSSGIVPLVSPDETTKVEVGDPSLNGNPLLALDPAEISLPKGARFTLKRPSQMMSEVEIRTDHSRVSIRFFVAGGGQFQPQLNRLTQSIATKLGLNLSAPHMEHLMALEWESELYPFTRFSRISEKQSLWFEQVKEKFMARYETETLLKRF